VAREEGEDKERSLLLRSGAAHLVAVAVSSLACFLLSTPALHDLALHAHLPSGVAILAATGLGLWLPRGAPAALAVVALALGTGVFAASFAVHLPGLGVTLGLAWASAEVCALGARLGGRSAWAAPASIIAVVLATAALSWTLERSELASSPGGIATGGALALAFALHARWGEGAAALRHASSQVAAAALTRWLEVPREILLWGIRSAAGESDPSESTST
jgi:hypothetical protein